MTTLAVTFDSARQEQRRALMPYLMAGYPSEDAFCEMAQDCFDVGCDVLEVGIPFSDPLADGPVIQQASCEALRSGVNIQRSLHMLSKINRKPHQQIVIMSYYNPVLQYGLESFLEAAGRVGVSGLIVPDLAAEESKAVNNGCTGMAIDLIQLLAPTSTEGRRSVILKQSRGFVYLVSVAGVTGMRNRLPAHLPNWIADIKARTATPVAVGFGIGTAAQAREAAQYADGVIVGSALIRLLQGTGAWPDRRRRAVEFVCELRQATSNIAVHPSKQQGVQQ